MKAFPTRESGSSQSALTKQSTSLLPMPTQPSSGAFVSSGRRIIRPTRSLPAPSAESLPTASASVWAQPSSVIRTSAASVEDAKSHVATSPSALSLLQELADMGNSKPSTLPQLATSKTQSPFSMLTSPARAPKVSTPQHAASHGSAESIPPTMTWFGRKRPEPPPFTGVPLKVRKVTASSSLRDALERLAEISDAGSDISASHSVNESLNDAGSDLGNLTPTQLWASNLQVLYQTLEGTPLTLAQVISARKTQSRAGITRRVSGLIERPVNPLSGLSIRAGVTATEACELGGVPMLESRLHVPAISRDQQLLESGFIEVMKLIYMANGMSPEETDIELLHDVLETGIPDMNNPVHTLFKQVMDNQGYDTHIWAILMLVVSLKSDSQLFSNEQARLRLFLEKGATICSTHFLGTGSLVGQVGRIKKGIDVHTLTGAGNSFDRSTLDQIPNEYLLDTMSVMMPYPHCSIVEGSVDIIPCMMGGGLKVLVEGKPTDFPPIVVNGAAHDGPPWSGHVLKTHTLIQDCALLARFLEEIGSGVDDEGRPTTSSLQSLAKMVHVKAKHEVQNFNTHYYKKVRNIFPANAITGLLFAPFQRVAHRRNFNFINHATSRSLMGIPLCTSGMEEVLAKMVGDLTEHKRSVCFYADNITILELNEDNDVSLASVDLNSEESRHDERTAALTIIHILRTCYNTTYAINNGNVNVVSCTGISKEFAQLLVNIGGSLLVNCIGIIGNAQIPIPGMPSGCPLTYDVNSAATAPAVHEMMRHEERLLNRDGSPSEHLDAIMKAFSLPYKCEYYCGPADNSSSEFQQAYNSPLTPFSDGMVIRLDLLGFDAIRFHVDSPGSNDSVDLTFAVLNEERYHKMFWFTKGKSPNRPQTSSRLGELRNTIFKYSVAYLCLGGFIPSRSAATLAVINNAAFNIRSLLGPEVNPLILLGLDGTASDDVLLDTIETSGLFGNDAVNVRNAVAGALINGHINFGEVVRAAHGETALQKLVAISNRHPEILPPSLFDFDPLSSDFLISASNILRSPPSKA